MSATDDQSKTDGAASAVAPSSQPLPAADANAAPHAQHHHHHHHMPPADGWRAWSVCFGVFCAGFISLGWTYAQGVFVVPLLNEFGSSLTETSLIGTMVFVFFFVGGLVSGPISNKYGVKKLIIFGSIVWLAGVFLGSFSTAVWQSILTQGVMTGIGSSCVYWPSLAVTPAWFVKYRATAMGAAVLGSSIGLLAMSLGGQQILDAYGWRTTLRIFGGVGAGLLSVSVLLIDRRTPPHKSQGLFTVTWQLVKLRSFQLFIVAVFFFQFCFFIPYLFIEPYSIALTQDTGLASLALSMLGIGSSVGRITLGPIADYINNRMLVYRLSTFFGALCLAIWPVCTSYSQILAFCFFYGLSGGGVAALFTAVAADLWGAEKLGGVIPAISLISIPGAFAASPLFSVIVQSSNGNYNGAIWFTSACLALSLVFIMLIRNDPIKEIIDDDDDDDDEEKGTNIETKSTSVTTLATTGAANPE